MHIEWYKCLYDISYSIITTRDVGSSTYIDMDMIWILKSVQFCFQKHFSDKCVSVYVVPDWYVIFFLILYKFKFIFSKRKTIKYITESDKVYEKNLPKKMKFSVLLYADLVVITRISIVQTD